MNFLYKEVTKNPQGRTLRIQKGSTLGIFSFFLSFLFLLFPHTTHANTLQRAPTNLGLVGYWSFNDGSGGTAADYSGNHRDGTLTYDSVGPIPTWVSGKAGTGLSFVSAQKQYVSLPADLIHGVVGTTGTISLWFKTTSYGPMFAYYNPGVSAYVPILYVGTTGLLYGEVWLGFVSPLATSNTVNDGKWHQATITWAVNTQSLYLDGVQVGSPNFGTINNIDMTINSIGKAGGWSGWPNSNGVDPGYFDQGTIDEVRVYNRALSASEVATLYNSKVATRRSVSNQGLLGYWPLDEGSGTQIFDVSGNHNDFNFVLAGLSWIPGRRGSGVSSAAGYASTSLRVPVPINGAQTLNAWYRLGSVPPVSGTAMFTVRTNAGTGGHHFGYDGSGNFGIALWGGGDVMRDTVPAVAGRWYMGTFTYDGVSAYKLYKDGVLISTSNTNNLQVGNIEQIIISGYGETNNERFLSRDGIDDFSFYNRALSAGEIAALYRGGQQNLAKTQTSLVPSGLVGYWPFDGRYVNWGTGKVLDVSGNGNDGVMIGGIATSTGPATGKSGQAMNFVSANSQYLDAGAPASLNLSTGNKFTLSAWVYPTSPPYGTGVISEMYNPTNTTVQYEIGFDIDGSTAISRASVGFYDNISWKVVNDSSNVALNTWTHIAGTWDGTTMSLYKNGVLVTATTPGGSLPATNYDKVVIGRRHDAAGLVNFFPGRIDEARIYNRALTAAEIYQLYSASR